MAPNLHNSAQPSTPPPGYRHGFPVWGKVMYIVQYLRNLASFNYTQIPHKKKDDTALLGGDPQQAEDQASRLVHFLPTLRVQVNLSKSMTREQSHLEYLGQVLGLVEGFVHPPPKI